MTDSELKYIQLERTMQFWRGRAKRYRHDAAGLESRGATEKREG